MNDRIDALAYSLTDYLDELRAENKKDIIGEKCIKQFKARKNHICEKCGTEIHRNEYYYMYKRPPIYYRGTIIYDHWRKRCIDCKPKSWLELIECDINDY